MSVGLIALLDDVAALARMAATQLDDVAAQATKAGTKAAGVVIDDAAVTPGYVTGFAASREIPIVAKIALGSLRNKLIFLLPGALVLSFFAPWAITPLLMLGGFYLAYEGAEKVYEKLFPHKAHAHEEKVDAAAAASLKVQEDRRVASAIKTDFILSAEIMAITLAGLPEGSSLWMQAIILAVVGIGVTVAVYGVVALIVKADDAGLAMARNGTTNVFGSIVRGLGCGLVVGMPVFLKVLTVVGTAAMVWVGGGILVHGLEHYGIDFLAHGIEAAAEAAAHAVPALAGVVHWLVTAAGSGVVGLIAGALLIPLVGGVLAPAWLWVNAQRA
ncbi:DUF808 domain-containing protein [Aurantimonas sp. HBX-1]|uniref:DUF808 domain-containing protein n=1 Tax=Aurantimonas sp. HBX-1 TaxID=2906072 RepID=UPI001F3B3109|nr:DUF808 domain-containing protein [Aurantimonas sp. HBX-1]UIJ72204.1 DUF808 domain-containing protein [Aurantimonas sp. HBX-1]